MRSSSAWLSTRPCPFPGSLPPPAAEAMPAASRTPTSERRLDLLTLHFVVFIGLFAPSRLFGTAPLRCFDQIATAVPTIFHPRALRFSVIRCPLLLAAPVQTRATCRGPGWRSGRSLRPRRELRHEHVAVQIFGKKPAALGD